MTDIVDYEKQEAVAIITTNRPDDMNAFTTQLCAKLLEAFETAHNDESIRAVVWTGRGRSFSAGADLRYGFEGRTVFGKLHYEYRPVLNAIAAIPKPVIAAVNGSAVGIGLAMALQCDLLIMADDAFMLSPFTTISLVPDGGLNWQLVRQLGYRRAYQLSVESEQIDAMRCVELGLANRTVPADQLASAAVQWAARLAKRAPLSLAATKRAMRYAMDHDFASSFDVEAELQQVLRNSRDCEEGVTAFFEKRKADFEGE